MFWLFCPSVSVSLAVAEAMVPEQMVPTPMKENSPSTAALMYERLYVGKRGGHVFILGMFGMFILNIVTQIPFLN